MINIRRITLTALMAALIFVLTTVPRIPVPATGGYVHLGDAGIAFAAAAFGPWVAMAAGGGRSRVPALLPDTDEEMREWDAGALRRAERLRDCRQHPDAHPCEARQK